MSRGLSSSSSSRSTATASARRRQQQQRNAEQDGDWLEEDGQQQPPSGGGRIPLQPPRSSELYETEEDWLRNHRAEETDRTHHLPLILVALPPLGAIVHGRAENWSDALILILICFYLYYLVKVPWDIYYASHGRVVLQDAEPRPGEDGYDPELAAHRNHSVRVLRRVELTSLAFTFVVPFLGSYLLVYARQLLSDPDRYINSFVIGLFGLATSVKPLLHFSKLVKRHALYHQEQVWYPNTQVHFLKGCVEALEKDLRDLSRAFATKDDIRNLRDGVDHPLTELEKAMRRFDKNETKARLTAEQRFQLLDAKLERTTREMLATSQQLEQLRYEQEQARSSTLAHILRVLKYALGHTRSGPAFWLFLPITAPRAAIEYVANSTSPKVEQGEVLGGGVESTSTGSEASGSSAEEVGRGASGRGYRAAVGRAQVGGRKGFR